MREALKNVLPKEIPIPNDYRLPNPSAESDVAEAAINGFKDDELPFYLVESENAGINAIEKSKAVNENQDKKK